MFTDSKNFNLAAKIGVKSLQMTSWPVKIFRFYVDGFKSMTLGRTLWKIIFIKLFVMFAVLKLFFFPNFLTKNFSTDKQRADYVLEQITKTAEE